MKKTVIYVYGYARDYVQYYNEDIIGQLKIGETTVDVNVDKWEAADKRVDEQGRKTGRDIGVCVFDVFEFPERCKTDDAIRKKLTNIYTDIESSKTRVEAESNLPHYHGPGNEWVYDVTRDQVYTAIGNYTSEILCTTKDVNTLQQYAVNNIKWLPEDWTTNDEKTKIIKREWPDFIKNFMKNKFDIDNPINDSCWQWKPKDSLANKRTFHYEIKRARAGKFMMCFHREHAKHTDLMNRIYEAFNNDEMRLKFKINKTWSHENGAIEYNDNITANNIYEATEELMKVIDPIIADYFENYKD